MNVFVCFKACAQFESMLEECNSSLSESEYQMNVNRLYALSSGWFETFFNGKMMKRNWIIGFEWKCKLLYRRWCIHSHLMVGHRTKFYTVMISFFFFLLLSLSLVLLVLIVAVVLAIIRQKKIELSLTQRLLLLSSSLINGKAFVLALNGVFIQRKNSYTLNWFHYFLFQVI